MIGTVDTLKKQLKLTHPDSEDLAFLYGTIVTDGKDQYSEDVSWNVCVFAEREVCTHFCVMYRHKKMWYECKGDISPSKS